MSKGEEMVKLAEEVKACRRCGLWRSRRNAVVGEGSADTSIMLIGEAPGYNEDLLGRPFVGLAGKVLDELLTSVGLSRGEVYIGNVLKCRPPDNRDPLPDEVSTCTFFLDRQIEIIKPRVVITLGRHSTSYILSKIGLKAKGITRLRGKIISGNLLNLNVFIIPTYHPAAALYNPRLRKELEEDFKLLKLKLKEIGGGLFKEA